MDYLSSFFSTAAAESTAASVESTIQSASRAVSEQRSLLSACTSKLPSLGTGVTALTLTALGIGAASLAWNRYQMGGSTERQRRSEFSEMVGPDLSKDDFAHSREESWAWPGTKRTKNGRGVKRWDPVAKTLDGKSKA